MKQTQAAVVIHQTCPLFASVTHRYLVVGWKILCSSNIPREKSRMGSCPESEEAIQCKTMKIRCSVVSCTIISLADMTVSSSVVRLEAFLRPFSTRRNFARWATSSVRLIKKFNCLRPFSTRRNFARGAIFCVRLKSWTAFNRTILAKNDTPRAKFLPVENKLYCTILAENVAPCAKFRLNVR